MTRPEFIVTVHDHLPGVRLSCVGSWGNLPFDSVEAAEGEAIRIGGVGAIITHERPRARKGRK